MPTAKKTAETKPTVTAFDLSNLTATDAEPIKHTRKSKVDDGPLPGWLQETKESGKAKSVTVPADQVQSVSNALRNAATRLQMGIKRQVKKNDDGTATITFQGAEKITRNRKSAETKAE